MKTNVFKWGAALVLLISMDAFGAKQAVLRLVGTFEGRSVTSRDVVLDELVQKALSKSKEQGFAEYGSEAFVQSLNRALVEMMVSSEAQNFGVAKLTEAEIDGGLSEVKNRIQSQGQAKAQVSKLGLTDANIKDAVQRKLRAQKFIKYKTSSSFVEVSDEEALSYFNKNKSRFGNMSFETFRPSIKKFLGQKNADDRIRDWIEVLKRKYKVRNFLNENLIYGLPNSASTSP